MGEDIIAAFIRRLLEDVPNTSPETVQRIENGLRRDFGGSSHYAKRAPAEGKVLRLGNALAAGVSLGAAISEIGCTKQHAYRLLRRRWRRK